jgi:hypothetical protein
MKSWLLKDWQRTSSFEQVSEIEIYRMIHKNHHLLKIDFNHQYYGGFVVDLFMILMQTIILKTSIASF